MSESDPPSPREASRKPALPPAGPWWSRKLLWQVLGIGAFVVAALSGARTVEHKFTRDPELCTSCHVSDGTEVHKSAHKTTECAGCHESKFGQNMRQWALGLVSENKTTPHGATDRTLCRNCHVSGESEPWHMARTKGHAAHVLNLKKPLACQECHTWKEHVSEPKPEACGACHKDVKVFGAHRFEDRKEKIGCLSCHNYLSRIGAGAHTPSNDCQRCHGGVESQDRSARFEVTLKAKPVLSEQIHSNLKTCSVCHNPHKEQEAERTIGKDCSRCHTKVSEEHHDQKQPDKFDCNTCHEVHGPRASLTQSCANCHQQSKDPPVTVAMQHERCSTCHTAHEFVASLSGCKDCHADQTKLVASWKADKHDNCLNCHKPHTAQEETAACLDCHKLGAHEHKACTTCHDPHLDETSTKGCPECHKPEVQMVNISVPAHRAPNCSTCHKMHAFGGASKTCAECHAGQSKLVATAGTPKHAECASCHQPHGFSAEFKACNSCHQIGASGAHTGVCNRCHETHGPPVGKAAACSNCHQDVGKPGGKHAECGSCHKASHGPEVSSAPCGTCHEPQANEVRAFTSPTHKNCQECHQAHNPTNPKLCNQCHATQASTLKGSRHTCASCHDTHRPAQKPCATCHASEVDAVRGRGPTHSQCSACHKPHSTAQIPSCASCHTSLPAAHTIKGHQRCNDCHATHARSIPTRGECVKCHTGLENHFPETQNCANCHLFK